MAKPGVIRKIVIISVTVFILGSVVLTKTLAWHEDSQHKNNEFKGLKISETGSAALGKLDKETGKALPGAEFELYKVDEKGEETLAGRYTSNQNGMIWVDHLEEGSYYWLETRIPYGWTFDKDEDGNEIKKYPFIIEADGKGVITPVVLRVYNQRLYADLVITNSIVKLNKTELEELEEEETPDDRELPEDEAPPGDLELNNETGDNIPATPAPSPDSAPVKSADDTIFDFTIELTGIEDGPINIIIDGNEKEIIIIDGQIKLKLKDGQTAIIRDVPVGTYYDIIETQVDGYIMASVNYQGNIPPNGVSVPIINYLTDEEPGKLIVKKLVTGNGADLNKKFEFVVNINSEETIFKLKHGEQKEFILAPDAQFSVHESNYLLDGYESNTEMSIMPDKNYGIVVKVRQINHYIGSILTDIKGEKTWDLAGQDIDLPDSITVYLKDGEAVLDSVKVMPDEKGRWLYHFVVPKYRSDGVTEILYSVGEAPVKGFSSTISDYNIHNARIGPEAIITPSVKKNISGKPKEKTTFQFRLIGEDGAPMPEGSKDGEKIITITGAGEAGFGQIQYTGTGTWHYTIAEVQAGEPDWTYDKTIYILNVVVREQDGALICSKTLEKAGTTQNHDKAEFTNVYGKSGNPEGSGGSKDHGADRPRTGDESNIWPWAITLIVSALILRVFLLRQRTEKGRKA